MSWYPMIRLGATTQELAYETLENLLGYPNPMQMAVWTEQKQDPGKGHKPARADIQKYKDIYDEKERIMKHPSDPNISPAKEWESKYGLTKDEKDILSVYAEQKKAFPEQNPDIWFYRTVELYAILNNEAVAKKLVGQALKKREEYEYPILYQGIQNTLTQLYRNAPESYKLWPWAIKQMKDSFRNNIGSNPIGGFGHIYDITYEAGSLLSRLKAENRTPPNMDFNQMNLNQLEDWLMQWKRDNREAEAQGEVVYQFHDGWTIQRLTTPEQLQFEGDEMGHCVGGYSSAVEAGSSIIYSLRDPKGMPHTTFEIEGLLGYSMAPTEENQYYVDQGGILEQKYYAPHNSPDPEEISNHRGMKFDPTYQVVQVQGKSDGKPKPEYQHKVKEFLDALRDQGIKFERSVNWYGNYDEYGNQESDWQFESGWGHRYPNNPNAQILDDWYDDYRENTDLYQNGGEDAYGLNNERPVPNIPNFDDIIIHTMAGMTEDYDRERFNVHNWKEAAQATYHLFWLYEEAKTPEEKKRDKEGFQNSIEVAWDTLNQWEFDYIDSLWGQLDISYIIDKYEQAGGKFEEDEWGEPDTDNPLDEDLWDEARQELERELAGDYLGKAPLYLNYLGSLVGMHDGHHPSELPNPNKTNGGLPDPDTAINEYNRIWNQQQQKNIEIPGALSSVR